MDIDIYLRAAGHSTGGGGRAEGTAGCSMYTDRYIDRLRMDRYIYLAWHGAAGHNT